MSNKSKLGITIILLVGLHMSYNYVTSTKANQEALERFGACADVAVTQAEAQALFDSDPVKYKRLDGRDDDNNDGNRYGVGELACEHLPLK